MLYWRTRLDVIIVGQTSLGLAVPRLTAVLVVPDVTERVETSIAPAHGMRLAFNLEGIDWTFHVSADSVSRTPPLGLLKGGVLQEYKEWVSRRATTGADDDNSSNRKESVV